MREVMRSISSRWRLAVVVVVTLTALVAGVLLVRAEPVPRTFTYQGVLTDTGGTPISGDHTITIRVYADDTTGTPLCTEIEAATVVNGLFRVTVGDGGCTVDAGWFTLTAPVYLGITVDTTTLTPRVPLLPVASAYQAEHAENTDRHVVHRGGAEISVGGVYCGVTATMSGTLGGYAGAKVLCESACGDLAAHMCSTEEMVRSAQLGIPCAGASPWVAGGFFGVGSAPITSGIADCNGWTSSDATVAGGMWGASPLRPSISDCNTGRPVACCL